MYIQQCDSHYPSDPPLESLHSHPQPVGSLFVDAPLPISIPWRIPYFIHLSLNPFISVFQTESLSCCHLLIGGFSAPTPPTPCGPNILMWVGFSQSFLKDPLKLFCQSIFISVCHLWISKSTCYKGTISHDTFLRYRWAAANKVWNKDMTSYQHLNHHNSRCLDASAKTQTLTAKTMCLHQNQVNLL